MSGESVYVVGAGMARFGKFPAEVTLEKMAVSASREALVDAGCRVRDIDGVYFGTVLGGSVAGQRTGAQLGLTGQPVTNLENACSSGATAIRDAWLSVKAGLHDVVLAIGAEKMTDRISGGILADASDLDAALGMIMASNHGMSARRYMHDYGATRAQIAAVAVKNHAHSVHNPYAQYQHPVTLEQVLDARPIAEPLGLLDCSPISDGAAAIVIASEAGLARLGVTGRPPRILGVGLVSGTIHDGARSVNEEDISRRGGEEAWRISGVSPTDIDFVEMHDCFTIAEIVRMEGLGLIPRGEGGMWTEQGHTSIGGKLPVNPSGGLLSRGHPVGATGVAQACELTWQLRGTAGARQVEEARTALAYCKGGTVAGTDGASVSTLVMQA
ncbi:thiolase family protein [Aeromicrobium sp. YIM 150415]|uniref:thiolase family protein n=1 Tax=Aeromicrobium sp. YIM 150415 TaxID=2803912 RepID=UPI0019630053|nr:thiolase family protein [Aeromicrobium sp. YIM 150415]MBM9464397.1 thiolase family protein [Aeromicrobium sp. YIM 150415]